MSEPFFHTDCPSCGAPIHAHSPTSVTLVCGYCNSMLVRQDGGIIDKGRDSALLEDFSPLQIGTRGRYGTAAFNIIGRLQMHYDAGVWNEWHILFDEGGTGWLSESGDIYSLTRPQTESALQLPPFDDIRAGFSTLDYNGKRFMAADVRRVTMKHAAAQGELPFEFNRDSESRTADWRCENLFLTTNYGDDPPSLYAGNTVKLDDLQLENLRTEDQITAGAGRLKGTRQSENCPNCGSPVHWVDGLANNIVCPSCGSDLEAVGGTIELIEADAMRAAQQKALTLPVGSKGKLRGRNYIVIGAVHKEELEAQTAFDLMYAFKRPTGIVPEGFWREYLLYHPTSGSFLWLIESDNGWEIAQTLHDWPRLDRHGQPQGGDKLYDYGSRVGYAAGAFYWHVRHRDLTFHSDYKSGKGKIGSELSVHEIAWSRSEPVGKREIAEAFGLPAAAMNTLSDDDRQTPSGIVWITLALLCVLNLPAFLYGDGEWTAITVGIAGFYLYNFGMASEDGAVPSLSRFLTVSLIVVSLATGLNYMFSNTDSSGYSGYNSSGGYYGGSFSGGHK